MNFLQWLNQYAVAENVDSQIINALSRIGTLYDVSNNSSTSSVKVAQAVNLYKAGQVGTGKIYTHIIIENNELIIAKSKIQKSYLDNTAEILPRTLSGQDIKSNISDVFGRKVTRQNVIDLIDALGAAI